MSLIKWESVEEAPNQIFASFPDGKHKFMRRLTISESDLDSLGFGQSIVSEETITNYSASGFIGFIHKHGYYADTRLWSDKDFTFAPPSSSVETVRLLGTSEDLVIKTTLSKGLSYIVTITYYMADEQSSLAPKIKISIPLSSLRVDSINLFMIHSQTLYEDNTGGTVKD